MASCGPGCVYLAADRNEWRVRVNTVVGLILTANLPEGILLHAFSQ